MRNTQISSLSLFPLSSTLFSKKDFDIAGEYGAMIPDAECLVIMCAVLKSLEVGEFKVKLNHRKLLEGMFELCGVPKAKFTTICSSIDKLDKMRWEEVREEIVKEKGVEEEVVDKLKSFVERKGKVGEFLEWVEESKVMEGNKLCQQSLEELKKLGEYLKMMGVEGGEVEVDLSLARGLNYYTGVIFEAVLTSTQLQVGSIGGGGRYDNLTSVFGKSKVPCVGFSIGVERIFAVLIDKAEKESKKLRTNYTQVYVASMDGCLEERMKIVSQLWSNGIAAEFEYKPKPKIKQQLAYADDKQIPLAIIVGSDEIQKGVLQLKNLVTKEQREIDRNSLVEEVKKALLL